MIKVFVILLSLAGLIGWTCTGAVYFSVRSTLQRSSGYSFEQQQTSSSNLSSGSGGAIALTREDAKLLREVRTQCVLYSLGYLNLFIYHFVVLMFYYTNPAPYLRPNSDFASRPGPFTLVFLHALFNPGQGLINAFVYNWPRTKDWKIVRPDRSWWYAWHMAFFSNQQACPTLRSSRRQLSSRRTGRSSSNIVLNEGIEQDASNQDSIDQRNIPGRFYFRESILRSLETTRYPWLSLFHPVTGARNVSQSGSEPLPSSPNASDKAMDLETAPES